MKRNISLQIKMKIKKNKKIKGNFFISQILQGSRRGVSVMIGYILLITIAIIIGSVVYQWMKTYIPNDSLECPDGVSIFIKDYNCDGSTLNLTLQNNGRFNIAGYFIYVTNDSNQELATIDLSQNITSGATNLSNSVIFSPYNQKINSFEPNDEKVNIFSLGNKIYSIEITPARFQESDNKIKFVSCSNAKVKEKIVCN